MPGRAEDERSVLAPRLGHSPTARTATCAGLLGTATLLVAWTVLGGRELRLGLPFDYRSDSLLNAMQVKGVLENGSGLTNGRLGWPLGQHLHDFPFADNLSLATMRFLGLFTSDWQVVVNLFFLWTFPAAAIAAFASVRHIGGRRATAVVVGALYALLPYHFLRGQQHLFLSAYAPVPMICAVAIDVLGGVPLVIRSARGSLVNAHNAFVVVALVSTACSVQYYPVMAGVLLVAAATLRALGARRVGTLLPGVIATATLLILLVLNLLPSLLYRLSNGANQDVAHRAPLETLNYSLRLTDLLLPMRQHRIPAVSEHMTEAWLRFDSAPVEFGASAIGLVAAVGLLMLLVVLLRSAVVGDAHEAGDDGDVAPIKLLQHHAALAVVAVLVGTYAGVSAVLAAFVSSPLRAWNRFSIFIAFFALAGFVEAVLAAVGRRSRVGVIAVSVALLVVGVCDQTSPSFEVDRQELSARWSSDRRFVKSIEAMEPAGGAVLQVPYLSFPENGQMRSVLDYDPFVGYLHAETLRFSYGAVRGRAEDWQRGLVGAPVPTAAIVAAAVGFDGVWVSRHGYPVTSEAVERALASATGRAAVRSENGMFSFVPLGSLATRVRSSGRVAAARAAALQPTTIAFGEGFGVAEDDGATISHPARGPARLVLGNPTDRTRTVTLRWRVVGPGGAVLGITGTPVTPGVLPPGQTGTWSEVVVDVAPGEVALSLMMRASDGQSVPFAIADVGVLDSSWVELGRDLGLVPESTSPVV